MHYTEQMPNLPLTFLKDAIVLYFPLGNSPESKKLWSIIPEKLGKEKWTSEWTGEDEKGW